MTSVFAGLDPLSVTVLAAVTIQRLGELIYSRRNELMLRASGAVEHGESHYPTMVAIHGAWLLGLWVFASSIRPDLAWLATFAGLQLLRVWVLATLRRRWTTRIMVLPGEPLVVAGPYRLMPHPNYAVVAAEIFALPMAYGLVWYALLFSGLNGGILFVRIRAENEALSRSSAARC
jgi:methyltransferase